MNKTKLLFVIGLTIFLVPIMFVFFIGTTLTIMEYTETPTDTTIIKPPIETIIYDTVKINQIVYDTVIFHEKKIRPPVVPPDKNIQKDFMTE